MAKHPTRCWKTEIKCITINSSKFFVKSALSQDFMTLLRMCGCVLSCFKIFGTLWTVASQAPLSVGFSRQESWSGLPCPPPGESSRRRDGNPVSCTAGRFGFQNTIGRAAMNEQIHSFARTILKEDGLPLLPGHLDLSCMPLPTLPSYLPASATKLTACWDFVMLTLHPQSQLSACNVSDT